ncbi:MAG: YciI family protein [Myxococcales bacterium]|nr:YciI family protein [Myxococcales bacterium]
MQFLIYCQDKPNHEELRKATRQEHLSYIEGFEVLLAGPTLDDSGEHMTGSVLVVELPDRQAALAFVAGDPYSRAGLFERTTIERFKRVIG